ncbi:M23 family metallopeptidase [Paracnuella aquatica]|nr:M23 family metallopeptidase [Paracnuella aquatica]
MAMKNNLFLLMLSGSLALASCGKVAATVFGPKTPREAYEQALDKKDLDKTPEGLRWTAAGNAALAQPVKMTIPFKLDGHFPAAQQLALGLQFDAKKGGQLRIALDKPAAPFTLYAELYQHETGTEPQLLHAADTAAQEFTYDIETAGTYTLRLQPELLKGGNYSITVTQGPSIGFPVTDPKANIGSFWGADRDGGKRRHEGVDIFAKKGSPAVAALDGYVTAIQETPIGGKVVWLRPHGKDYTLYYAHLDKHLVQSGQTVSKGDTLGTVGNTGNARTTPAHLHFGIYTTRGPVDPLIFVNKVVKKPAAVPKKSLAGYMRLTKAANGGTLPTNTIVMPVAVGAKTYLAALPDGTIMEVPFSAVQPTTKPLKAQPATVQLSLLQLPAADAATAQSIPKGSQVEVLGYFEEYTLVRAGNVEGWMPKG